MSGFNFAQTLILSKDNSYEFCNHFINTNIYSDQNWYLEKEAPMQSFQEQEYTARINRVMDYINNNLDRQLSLTELAKVANFSPFHFHRIFRGLSGETLNSFIQRVRIERAASMLLANPKKSITEIALDYGFSGSASFARLFKEKYGMSASQWRSGGYRDFSKIGKTVSKIGKTESKDCKDSYSPAQYFSFSSENGGGANHSETNDTTLLKGRESMSLNQFPEVEVKYIPEFTVAYVRHIGPYKGDSGLFGQLWGKLTAWAGPRDLMQQKDLKCLCLYQDDPEITDDNNLRLSICISVPKETRVDGEIGKMEIPAGKYAVARFELKDDEYQGAWDYVCGQWMSKSGYQPDDGVCYELMLNDPSTHPEHKHIVEIHVPVKPL
jgi:AraC family transcriptional regulator